MCSSDLVYRLPSLVQVGLKDLQGQSVHKVKRVPKVKTVLMRWEAPAALALRVWLAHLAALVQLDRRDRWDLPDHRANRDPLAQPGLVAPDHKVQPVRKVSRESKERKVRPELSDLKVQQDQQVPKALKVFKVHREFKVHKVFKVLEVILVQRERKVLKVFKGSREILAQLVFKGSQVRRVQLESQKRL